ncbi:MAG: rhodanese-like domain-containing protein [Caldilineaceae bacterium]
MGLFKSLSKLFGRSTGPGTRSTPPPMPEPEEIQVPQLSPAEIQSQSTSASCPLWLDVREQYEWNQVRVPTTPQRTVLHIPMNEIPKRLEELPKGEKILVFCAHGSRSESVAAWLIEQGYQAKNLAGGITQWAVQGGEVETGKASGGGAGGWQ